MKTESQFPYVVIRWMSAVYGRRSVDLKHESANNTIEIDKSGKIYQVSGRNYVSSDGTLTPEGKNALELRVIEDVKMLRLRMCVVYGDKECVYLELDQPPYRSQEVPTDGFRMDKVITE